MITLGRELTVLLARRDDAPGHFQSCQPPESERGGGVEATQQEAVAEVQVVTPERMAPPIDSSTGAIIK